MENARLELMRKVLLLSLFFLLLGTRPVFAQEVSLGIYPPIIDITATPPAQIKAPITVSNDSDKPVELLIALQPFKGQRTNDGQIEFVPDLTGPDPKLFEKVQIIDGDTAVDTVNIDARQEKTLTFLLDIDKETSFGDYYFSVIFVSKNKNQPSNSSADTPSGVGTNVLLSIGPKGKTRGSVDSFTSPFFVTGGPIKFDLALNNDSDHFILPTGAVIVQNIFGQRVGKVDLLPQYLLAHSTRYLRHRPESSASSQFIEKIDRQVGTPYVLWPEKFLLGIYSATATIALSDNGPVITSTTYFIALPVPFIVFASIVVFVIAGIYLRVTKKLSKLHKE